MKRAVIPYDFNAFGQAIKAARMAKGESRKNVSVSPRYLANIENKGQQPSLQIFYELVTRYHISVDQFFSRMKQQTRLPAAVSLIPCLTI